MSSAVSLNTEAILLLTAPLQVGRSSPTADLLPLAQYNRLARFLHQHGRQPADLLGSQAEKILTEKDPPFEVSRLERLLSRGFLLSQAIERWRARGIWVVSRADADYPKRFRERLKDQAPPILFGCGRSALLDGGGLAVVGSRNAEPLLLEWAEKVGAQAAAADLPLISGGARGIDQAAMRGACRVGGIVTGVLADQLDRAVLSAEHREPLRAERLVLVSPFDPAAGFHVGQAMQRNKLIYALADAALVVNADDQRGGTWAGAVEQLEKWRWLNVFVRAGEPNNSGLAGLQSKGALPWPAPASAEELRRLLQVPPVGQTLSLFSSDLENPAAEAVEVWEKPPGERA